MKQRRFFAPASCWQGGHIVLDPQQSHHIRSVLRLHPGDTVTCFDGEGKCAKTRIVSIESNHTVLDIVAMEDSQPVLPVRLTLAQAVIKSQRMDLIIQKAAELGVDCLIPIFSANTVVDVAANKQLSKLQRWQKISVESAKQCVRNVVMQVDPFMELSALTDNFASYDAVFMGSPYVAPLDLSQTVASCKNILLVIGPEGGFTDQEMAACTESPNYMPWRFSNTVLRAETAAITAVGIMQYALLSTMEGA